MNPFRKVAHYVHNVLVGADQEANVILGGKLDETISSRSQRAANRGNKLGRAMTSFLHVFQRDHGKLAQQGDIDRAKEVIKLEEDGK